MLKAGEVISMYFDARFLNGKRCRSLLQFFFAAGIENVILGPERPRAIGTTVNPSPPRRRKEPPSPAAAAENLHHDAGVTCSYSPKSRRTLFNTLSFSGSYGWSFDGISKSAGNAAVYVSTRCRILSAIYTRFSACYAQCAWSSRRVTYVLIYEHYRYVLPLLRETLKRRFDRRVLGFLIHY